jgi:hypothetical protein
VSGRYDHRRRGRRHYHNERWGFVSNVAVDSPFRVERPVSISGSYFEANDVNLLFAETVAGRLYALTSCYFEISVLPALSYAATFSHVFDWEGLCRTRAQLLYLSTAFCQVSPLCPTNKFTGSSHLRPSAGFGGTEIEDRTPVFGGTAVCTIRSPEEDSPETSEYSEPT